MVVLARLEGEALLADPIADVVLATIRDRGYQAVTVDELARRANLSPTEFRLRFGSKEEITELILQAHVDRYLRRVGGVYAEAGEWPDNLRAAVLETVRDMLENPDLTWFMMVGILDAGEVARARRDEVFSWAAGLIDAGRSVAADPDAIPSSAAVMAVGAVVESLRRQQAEGAELDPDSVIPFLMYSAVRPYLGEEAARAELTVELPRDLRR
jgi:AcrR family transcriptional regulator